MDKWWFKLGLVIAVILCLFALYRINSDKKRIARLVEQTEELEISNKASNNYTVDEVYDYAVDEVYNEDSQSTKDISKSTDTHDGEYEFTDKCDRTFHLDRIDY